MNLPFLDHLDEHRRVFQALHTLDGAVQDATARCVAALRGGGRILACGNGGSAAQAEHFAAELVGRFMQEREALAALALTGPASALTSLANDYGFDEVFARQLRGLARAGDCLVLFSTSGQSPNVLRAAQAARALGVATVGLLGKGGGALAGLCDVAVVVPSDSTPRIQEAHLLLGHCICAGVEQALAGGMHA